MTIKHEGISRHRLSSNPLEAAFASEWEIQAPNTLGWLLCDTHDRRADYSERDALVAATIIQWLGSPVGRNFVETVHEKENNK